jgi:integrase/recombinase XerD
MTNEIVLTPARAAVPTTGTVSWREALEAYLDARTNSPNTRRAYARAVEEAFAWWDVETVSGVAPSDLAAYRAYLAHRTTDGAGEPLSTASVNLHLAGLRGFFLFASLTRIAPIGKDVIEYCLETLKSQTARPYEVLDGDEQRRILKAANNSERDYTLLALMLATGLRVNEVVNVKVGDLVVDNADGNGSLLLRVRQAKGRRERLVPISDGMRTTLRAYLDMTERSLGSRADRETYLFWSRQGPRLTTRRVRQIVTGYARKAGITDKAISPHSLRHTVAFTLLKNGADLPTVQRFLGHASIKTTQRYLDHLSLSDLRQFALSPTSLEANDEPILDGKEEQ